MLAHKCGLIPPNTQPELTGVSPVEGFLGGTKIILGLFELPHPALPSLLLLNAGLISPVCIPGQGTRCIHLQETGYRIDTAVGLMRSIALCGGDVGVTGGGVHRG